MWIQPLFDSCRPCFQFRSVCEDFMTDNYWLHQLTNAKQVANRDVRTTKIWLTRKEDIFHLVKRLVQQFLKLFQLSSYLPALLSPANLKPTDQQQYWYLTRNIFNLETKTAHLAQKRNHALVIGFCFAFISIILFVFLAAMAGLEKRKLILI